MSERISVYATENTLRKLGDIQKQIEADLLLEVSASMAVCYCIQQEWARIFEQAQPAWYKEPAVQEVVARYAPKPHDNGGGEP